MVSEHTGVLDTEATGGIVGRNMEHGGASTPLVPLWCQGHELLPRFFRTSVRTDGMLHGLQRTF